MYATYCIHHALLLDSFLSSYLVSSAPFLVQSSRLHMMWMFTSFFLSFSSSSLVSSCFLLFVVFLSSLLSVSKCFFPSALASLFFHSYPLPRRSVIPFVLAHVHTQKYINSC